MSWRSCILAIFLMFGFYLSKLQVFCKETTQNVDQGKNSDHLVVLVHGLMGKQEDLTYLATVLRDKGCVVLLSKANAWLKSLSGIPTAAERLVNEIHAIQKENSVLNGKMFRT